MNSDHYLYRWRALTYHKLGRQQEAEADIALSFHTDLNEFKSRYAEAEIKGKIVITSREAMKAQLHARA